MELLDLPFEVLSQMISHLDVKTILSVTESCRDLEAVCNQSSLWKSLIERHLGRDMTSPPGGWLNNADLRLPPNSAIRASVWKIRYAQLLQSMYPDHEDAEKRARDLKRRLVALALRNTKEGEPPEPTEPTEPDNQEEYVSWATKDEVPYLRMLKEVSYIPIRVAVLGNPGIGRTTTIMKYLRSYPVEEPFRADVMGLLTPASDRFGNRLYTTMEKCYHGDVSFHCTIVDPPSNNPKAQIAALRGVDAVIIGFACDDLASVEAIGNVWEPFVRKWLGPSVPISAVGLKFDRMANGVPGTAIFEILAGVGLRSFDLCVPPFKKSFWRSWTPPDCPLLDGTWI